MRTALFRGELSRASFGFELFLAMKHHAKRLFVTDFAELKHGRVNLSDGFCHGRPFTVVNNKNNDAVRRMIETDRHVTYHEIWEYLKIGMSQIQSILHKHLVIKKLCSGWILQNLTEAQKTDPVIWCNAMLIRFKKGASNLV
ncbi:hypothetical protein EVAR_8260_1 [Eumeta japonica]|uniref:Mariner Mos1 transposase n=1 Tax=Eumeta variegata TaxID=151549 RepID=A0A4C1TJ74_EUMVA|nr:hypothetical protein EVAR_8260_1 [Eumeta japonica]